MPEARVLRTREYVNDLLTWLQGQGKIAIIVHDNPDPDCLASALALRHLIAVKANRDAVITFSGIIGRSENLAMATELEIPLTPLGIIDLNEYPVRCLLDTQPGTGNNSLPAGMKVDIVIDHHPPRKGSEGCRWADIRPDYGVTATILYEYLISQNIYIGTKLATALFYAIKSETQDLGREAGRPDREAYLSLFPLTNKKLLYGITHPKLPKEYFLMMDEALRNSRIYGSVLISNLFQLSFPEVVAEMADLFLRLEGIDTTLCIGLYGSDVVLSMRTLRHDLNAGEVIRKIVSGMGAAGGHGSTAGGKIDGVGADRESVLAVERLLTSRLLEELGRPDSPPRELVPGEPSRD
jgi:nanoRNase/pAp phosphatase (c-di-AMP/oligoRNAs hydrolase)